MRYEKVVDGGRHVATIDWINLLMWDVLEFEGKRFIYPDGEKACHESSLLGFSNWRLPTIQEQLTLVDYTRFDPAINTVYFPHCKSGGYWTSTPYAPGYGYAWVVSFNHGGSGNGRHDHDHFVRAVRSLS